MDDAPKQMTDEELSVLLESHNKTAVGHTSDEVSSDQDDNLARYFGMPYGDEEPGSSNAMSFDVAEVVDWALPDLLEPFISGERVVEYEPRTNADEAWCDQATDYVQHVFQVDNPGVLILHDVAKTAMIQKLGVTKTTWKEETKTERCTLQGLSMLNLQQMQMDQDVTIIGLQAEPVPPEVMQSDAAQAYVDGQAYTVEIERRAKTGRVSIVTLPPDEFRVSARTADLKAAAYLCHEVEITRGELIDMGFDQAVVMAARDGSQDQSSTRRDMRFFDETRREPVTSDRNAESVVLREEYVRVDANGDGRQEMLQVFRVGSTILDRTEVDEAPFDCWTPDRIPHRLIGMALADKVKATQRIKTSLTRQLLDNVYLANQPRIEVPDEAVGDNTYDDLLTYRIGGLIRTRKSGMLQQIELPDRSGTAMQAIAYMDSVRERQSGIVRNGIAVESEIIDPKSATESLRQDRNEQVRKRLMARMFAETFMVPLFRRILKLIVKYQDAPRTIKLRGKWVEMDPRAWNAEVSAKVSVGLGHANKQELMAAAQIIGQAQQMAVPMGLAGPKQLYRTAVRLVEAAGVQFPEQYFMDPESEEGQKAIAATQQGDPKLEHMQAELQSKMQMRQMEMQLDAEAGSLKAQRDIQLEMLKIEARQAVEERKLDFDLKARMQQIGTEYQLGIQKLQAEMTLRAVQLRMEAALESRQQDHDIEIGHAKVQAIASAKSARAGANGASMQPVRFGGQVG